MRARLDEVGLRGFYADAEAVAKLDAEKREAKLRAWARKPARRRRAETSAHQDELAAIGPLNHGRIARAFSMIGTASAIVRTGTRFTVVMTSPCCKPRCRGRAVRVDARDEQAGRSGLNSR